jgi:putative transposase
VSPGTRRNNCLAHLNPLPTLWELPADLWDRLEYLINQCDPSRPTGRKRADARRILNGIIFRMRTGCQWNHLPAVYGDEATIHRTFQRRVELQLFELIWSQLVAECHYLGLLQFAGALLWYRRESDPALVFS